MTPSAGSATSVLSLRVREVIAATPRARIVRVNLGTHFFPYRPGQAVFISAHRDSKRRAYSLAGSPAEATLHGYLELLVGVQDDGEFVRDLALEPDATLDIQGPIGGFTFPTTLPQRVLFIAAGTGIAPLRAMLRHALQTHNGRFRLLYSARTPAEFAYRTELQSLADQGRLDLRMTATRDTGHGAWPGAKGRIDRVELTKAVDDADTLCFIAGPCSFVSGTTALLREIGVSTTNIKHPHEQESVRSGYDDASCS